ncbi:MAG: PLP-dependent transferase, partial [Vallitaleaceae bacterium]|nr:PLP-dependent transferase [Vallitaleaceae bacterium]
CCKQDGQILMARNSHKSIYHGVFMNRLDPIYLYPEYIDGYGMLGGIQPENVEKELQINPNSSCVIITSPTFEGFTSDIRAIADIVHRYGKILIVDEAHGAHFPFHPCFPKSALENGADVVIHSVHKTLPAFTQSALLHVKSERVDMDKLKDFLSIYQTTSPSYILMAGIDSCIRWLESDGERVFSEWVEQLDAFRARMSELENIKLLGKELVHQYGIYDMDPSRLVIVGKKEAILGKKVDLMLRNQYKLQVEMATLGSVVAISTVADEARGFDQLFNALYEIDGKNDYINRQKFGIISKSTKVFHPYEAFCKVKEWRDYKEAEGKICGQFVTLYPPGIPILAPGELITGDILQALTIYLQNGLTVIGLDQQRISVLK